MTFSSFQPHCAGMDISALSPKQLRAAADLKERIDALETEFNELLGGEVPVPAQAAIEAPEMPRRGRRKRRKLSPEGRAAISAAAKARWAALRMGKESVAVAAEPEPRVKRKRTMTAAWRRALARAHAARRAKAKAARDDVPF